MSQNITVNALNKPWHFVGWAGQKKPGFSSRYGPLFWAGLSWAQVGLGLPTLFQWENNSFNK
ncbi:hypothetical protein Q6314_27160, partial [Klebsiella pneumoniae]